MVFRVVGSQKTHESPGWWMPMAGGRGYASCSHISATWDLVYYQLWETLTNPNILSLSNVQTFREREKFPTTESDKRRMCSRFREPEREKKKGKNFIISLASPDFRRVFDPPETKFEVTERWNMLAYFRSCAW